MRDLLLTLLHLAVMTAKLCGPGGVRAVIAENLLLKQQLIVLRRASPAGAQPDAERPAALRIRVALPQSRTHPKGRHRPPPLDAPGVSSGLGASQVPPAVLVDAVPEEARTERAGRGTHPGHRRAQVAQSSVRLSTDCAHHLADVRDRHRQERRVPRAGETLSPGSAAEPDPRGCRSSATPQTASGAWTSFDASRSCSGATGCSWSWTSSRVASSASACTAARSRAPTSAACSTPPFTGRASPRHLSTDHDPLFEAHRWTANLRILEIDEIKTVPHVPLSHPFVERLIGTMRREFLDHVLFWNGRDLERKLAEFQAYYNAARVPRVIGGPHAADLRQQPRIACADLNHVRWVSHCRDLVQLPVAA